MPSGTLTSLDVSIYSIRLQTDPNREYVNARFQWIDSWFGIGEGILYTLHSEVIMEHHMVHVLWITLLWSVSKDICLIYDHSRFYGNRLHFDMAIYHILFQQTPSFM